MWQDHYTALLNSSPPSAVDLNAVLIEEEYDRFTPEEVCSAVKSLKNGKSQGLDCIYAEHLKYAADNLPVLLSMVFNSTSQYPFFKKNGNNTKEVMSNGAVDSCCIQCAI